MNRFVIKAALVGISAFFLVGCASNTFKPGVSDPELASRIANSPYPYSAHPELAPHLFAVIAPDATITIYNAGDESYVNFQVWANGTYGLTVDKLDARSAIAIAPNTLFSSKGISMAGAPADAIKTVQIWNKESLLDVQGPILSH